MLHIWVRENHMNAKKAILIRYPPIYLPGFLSIKSNWGMGTIPPTHHPKTTCGWIVGWCSYLSIRQISDYKKGRVFGGSRKMNIKLASSTCTTIHFYLLILQIHPISISKRKGWDAPLPSNTCKWRFMRQGSPTEKNKPLILIFYISPSFQTSTKKHA